MKSFCLAALVALSCLRAQATIQINPTWGDLRNANATLMPAGGLVLLVASPDGTFGGPTASSFVTGGDVVLFQVGLAQPGFFQSPFTVDLSSFPSVTTGNLMQLYWFPTLTLADYNDTVTPGPGAGTAFGSYRSDAGVDGSVPWVIPGANDQAVILNFVTASQGGSNPDSAGVALSVVPEASNLITAALAVGFCAVRLIRRARQK